MTTDAAAPAAATRVAPSLAVEELAYSYPDGHQALRGVTLTVEQGEFVAIVGPSGSGKSTLMHLLGCLDRPTSGTLRVGGVDVATLDDSGLAELRNRTIGFVFQSFHLLARTPAIDNVALPLVYRGVPKARRRAMAKAALEAVGLAHRLDHRPSQMSGGEQQRVAIARALVGDPQVVLADEPTGNLDSRNTQDVLRLLGQVHAKGQTIALVTHDARVACMADRVINLLDGQIVDDADITPRRSRSRGSAWDVIELHG